MHSLETSQSLTSEPDECSFSLSIPGENYLDNPGLETVGVGWSVMTGTWIRATAIFRSGVAALRCNNSAGTTVETTNIQKVPVVSGETLYLRTWHRYSGAYAFTGSNPVRARVNFYNSAGTLLTTTELNCPNATTTWQMFEAVVTTPANVNIVSASLGVVSAGQTGGFLWFDDMYFSYDASFVSYLQEVKVIDDSVTTFGGVIIDKSVSMSRQIVGDYIISVQCQDYMFHLNRFRLAKVYLDQTAKQIVTDILADSRLTGLGFSLSTQVDDGPTLPIFTFKYETFLECIARLADYIKFDWYFGYDKKLYFYDAVGATIPNAAWNLTSDLVEPYTLTASIDGLNYKEDVSQLRNAIYVQGGQTNSVRVVDNFTISYVPVTFGDAYIRRKVENGKTILFDSLELRLTSTLGGAVPQYPTIGIDGIDDPASFDFMCNYNEGSFWANEDFYAAAGPSSFQIEATYKYKYPLLTYKEDTASITNNGRFEHFANESKIETRENAELYAEADLTYFKQPLKRLSYTTTRPGLALGSKQTVTLPRPGISGSYLIVRLSTRYGEYLGANALYQNINSYFKQYNVELESL